MTDEHLARLYLRTLVSIEEGGHLVEAAVSPMAMGEVVHVITAWNPGEARPARHENDAASRRLRQVLVDRGLAPRRGSLKPRSGRHWELPTVRMTPSGHDPHRVPAAPCRRTHV